MPPPAGFLFVTCQVGAHAAVKDELARLEPELRFAFSRPGFLTFKSPGRDNLGLATRLTSEAVFVRAAGVSLGHVDGTSPEELARGFWKLASGIDARTLHVWPRDAAEPGEHGFEPNISSAAVEAGEDLLRHAPQPAVGTRGHGLNTLANRGELVLDCVLVEPNQWWVGCHRVDSQPSRWAGGIFRPAPPTLAVSRAYFKMLEALAWSQLPIAAGDTCVELGSAPGGASQALLAQGLHVVGIDPAEMDPTVLADENFQHIKKRGADLKRREYRGIRWLTADMNLVPQSTLGIVESIVTYPGVRPRGLLLTLKLTDWELASRIPSFLDRVRSWGFQHVHAKQLSHHRQEFCLAALRTAPGHGSSSAS